ncbi:hypothetical protein ACLB1M_01990 [Escherichia coli]
MRVQENIEAVNTVLEEIDAHDPNPAGDEQIDMLEDFEPRIDRDEEQTDPCLAFRTDRSGDTTAFSGFDGAAFRRGGAAYTLRLPPQEGRLRSGLASGNKKSGWSSERKSASSYADR